MSTMLASSIRRRPAIPMPWLVGAAALLFAVVDSTLLVHSPAMALALPAGIAFLYVALRNIPLAAALWIVLVYVAGLPGLEPFNNRVLYVVAICWLGMELGRRVARKPAFIGNRGMIVLVAAFVAWQIASIGWAPIPADGQVQYKDFFCLSLGFLVISSAITESQHVRWLAIAFVVGAVLSVLGGIVAGGGLTAAQDVSDTGASRFSGGGGDPNYLAAMIIPAIAFAGGLWVQATNVQRGWLLGGIGIMAIGLAATQSRGGFLALGVTMLAALLILRGRRRAVVAMVLLTIAGAVAYFVAVPAAWERIHAVKDAGSGSGRTDIWHVAWRIVESHPVAGVGLAQFPNVSPQYTRLPGNLSYVTNLVDQHIVVHNVYLQLWAETGIIGLLLYLAPALLAAMSAWRASVLFEDHGDHAMTALARSALLALIGLLSASFFLSNILARQTWVLFALGPVLLAIARRSAAAGPVSDPR